MVVEAHWPGATALEIANQVTQPIETKLKTISSRSKIISFSRQNKSTIIFQIRGDIKGDETPIIWANVRNKVKDIHNLLPKGEVNITFNDDFGDTFGIIYALNSPGYSPKITDRFVRDIREKLLTLSPERRFSEVAEILAIEVEKILFLSHGSLDRRQSLFEQGMDSLMGVELATTIESSFGIQLSTMVLAEGPTIERLSQIVLKEMHLFEGDDCIIIPPNDQELSLLAIKHGTAVSDDDYQRVKEALAREQK